MITVHLPFTVVAFLMMSFRLCSLKNGGKFLWRELFDVLADSVRWQMNSSHRDDVDLNSSRLQIYASHMIQSDDMFTPDSHSRRSSNACNISSQWLPLSIYVLFCCNFPLQRFFTSPRKGSETSFALDVITFQGKFPFKWNCHSRKCLWCRLTFMMFW